MRCMRPVGGGPVIALLDLVHASAELLPPMRDGWRQNKLFAIHAVEMSETQAQTQARRGARAPRCWRSRRSAAVGGPQIAPKPPSALALHAKVLMEAATTKR